MIETRWSCPACGWDSPDSRDACIRCDCPRDAGPAAVAASRRRFEAGRAIPDRIEYTCAKCGNHEKDTGELLGAGGPLSSLFNTSTRRFRSVSCTRCGYTEFYRVGTFSGGEPSPVEN